MKWTKSSNGFTNPEVRKIEGTLSEIKSEVEEAFEKIDKELDAGNHDISYKDMHDKLGYHLHSIHNMIKRII